MRPYIFVTIGVPACGKSSFYHRVASDESWGMGDLPVYISSDSIRGELFGDAAIQSDPDRVFSTLRARADSSLSKGFSIYLDATHVRKDWRKYAIDLAIKYNAIVVALYFDVSFLTALKRDHSRERRVGYRVIYSLFKRLETPTRAEGFDAVFRIGRDGEYTELEY